MFRQKRLKGVLGGTCIVAIHMERHLYKIAHDSQTRLSDCRTAWSAMPFIVRSTDHFLSFCVCKQQGTQDGIADDEYLNYQTNKGCKEADIGVKVTKAYVKVF